MRLGMKTKLLAILIPIPQDIFTVFFNNITLNVSIVTWYKIMVQYLDYDLLPLDVPHYQRLHSICLPITADARSYAHPHGTGR